MSMGIRIRRAWDKILRIIDDFDAASDLDLHECWEHRLSAIEARLRLLEQPGNQTENPAARALRDQ